MIKLIVRSVDASSFHCIGWSNKLKLVQNTH